MFPYSELPNDIVGIILDFLIPPIYKLLDWIDYKHLKFFICYNPKSIDILQTYPEIIKEIHGLSINPKSYILFKPLYDHKQILLSFLNKIQHMDTLYKIGIFISYLQHHKLDKYPIFKCIVIEFNKIMLYENINDIQFFMGIISKYIGYIYDIIYDIQSDLNRNISCYTDSLSFLEKYQNHLNWKGISRNPVAIPLLEKNPDKINWDSLSLNSNAIHILEANPDKINWELLSHNINGIELIKKYKPNNILLNWIALSDYCKDIIFLKENLDYVDWLSLSGNKYIIPLLKENLNNIDWRILSLNPNAISLLEENYDKINWSYLSSNPNAIDLLKKTPDKIDWTYLSSNPNAISLLKENIEKIDWYKLSTNPNAIHLLKANPDKIDWYAFTNNPNIFELDLLTKRKYIKFLLQNKK